MATELAEERRPDLQKPETQKEGVQNKTLKGFAINTAPGTKDQETLEPAPVQLSPGFVEFYAPLHSRFTPWQQELIANRKEVLAAAHQGKLPTYLPPSEATTTNWKIALPDWARDQRNQPEQQRSHHPALRSAALPPAAVVLTV